MAAIAGETDSTLVTDYDQARANCGCHDGNRELFRGRREHDYPDSGQLLALLDALHAGTLNHAKRVTAQTLRAGILTLAENGNGAQVQAV